jgi:putative ABC transport system substrate-binding protein
MTRRAAFLAALALAAVVAGARLPGVAQQPGKMFRIGILSPAGSPSTKAFDALREGLRELGYIDGANIAIEYRLAAGDYGRLPAMAADMVRLPVDLIVTDSGIATQIAQQATRAIPIVAATVGPDPVATGLAAGLARPGGNVTGFTGFELGAKGVELLKEVLPAVSRIAALRNPASNMSSLLATEEAARVLGLHVRPIAVATPGEIPARFETAIDRGWRRGARCPARWNVLEREGADRRPRGAAPATSHLRGTGIRPTRNGNTPMMAG